MLIVISVLPASSNSEEDTGAVLRGMATEAPPDLKSPPPGERLAPASKNSRPPVTQLEFRQAMRDFRSMFPEMEPSVIEAVLRANGGGVDATIDQLLAMATDNDNERLRTELEATENAEAPPHYSPPGRTPPPSYQQATTPLPQGPTEPTPPRLAGEEDQSKSSTKAPSWKPPLLGPLPPGFLRLQQPSPPSPTEGSPQVSNLSVREERESLRHRVRLRRVQATQRN